MLLDCCCVLRSVVDSTGGGIRCVLLLPPPSIQPAPEGAGTPRSPSVGPPVFLATLFAALLETPADAREAEEPGRGFGLNGGISRPASQRTPVVVLRKVVWAAVAVVVVAVVVVANVRPVQLSAQPPPSPPVEHQSPLRLFTRCDDAPLVLCCSCGVAALRKLALLVVFVAKVRPVQLSDRPPPSVPAEEKSPPEIPALCDPPLVIRRSRGEDRVRSRRPLLAPPPWSATPSTLALHPPAQHMQNDRHGAALRKRFLCIFVVALRAEPPAVTSTLASADLGCTAMLRSDRALKHLPNTNRLPSLLLPPPLLLPLLSPFALELCLHAALEKAPGPGVPEAREILRPVAVLEKTKLDEEDGSPFLCCCKYASFFARSSASFCLSQSKVVCSFSCEGFRKPRGSIA